MTESIFNGYDHDYMVGHDPGDEQPEGPAGEQDYRDEPIKLIVTNDGIFPPKNMEVKWKILSYFLTPTQD